MNYSDLQTEIQSLTQFGGFTNISPTPDYAVYANKGLRRFSWDSEYNIEELTFTTVANQFLYTLASPDFRAIHTVWYDSTSRLIRGSEDELNLVTPLWRFAASGTPTQFWMQNSQKMMLYIPPSATGTNVIVRGSRVAADMASSGDTPGCPEVYHRAIALFGALELMKRYATQDELAREQAYLAEYTHLLNEYRATLRSQNAAYGRRVRRHEISRVR